MSRPRIKRSKATVKSAWKAGGKLLKQTADILEVSESTARRLLVESGCIKAGEKLPRGNPAKVPVSPGKREVKRVFKDTGYRKNATAEVFGISVKYLNVWLDQHGLQP